MEIMLESLMMSERREYLQEEGIAGTNATTTVPAGHTIMNERRPSVYRVTDTATSILVILAIYSIVKGNEKCIDLGNNETPLPVTRLHTLHKV